MVSHGNGLEWADRCGFTNTYRGGPPYQIDQPFDRCRRLPNLTRFLASPAKTLGVSGLVAWPITIAYHVSDLALDLPSKTFTNHYRRGQETHN